MFSYALKIRRLVTPFMCSTMENSREASYSLWKSYQFGFEVTVGESRQFTPICKHPVGAKKTVAESHLWQLVIAF